MVESLRPVLASTKPAPGGQRTTQQQPFNTALAMTMGRGIELHGIKRTARQLGITPQAVKRARKSHLSNLAAGAAADWAALPLQRGRRSLNQDQLEYVRNFFEEHSSPSPMDKDVRRYYVRMTAGSSKKSEVRMSRRYVDRSLKKLYLEYEWECPVNLKVGSTTFEMLRPPWVKRITAAHKQVCVCIPCETCELQLDQLGKHMDSLVLPEDPHPLDDSDSDSGSESNGGDAELHVLLAEHIANADAQDLAGVLDAGALGEGGREKLVGDAQNARAAAGAIGGGVATTGGAAGGIDVRVDLDYATVQSWFVCPCKVGAKPSLACLQRQCAACKNRKVGVKAGCEGVQLQYREFKKLDNGQGVELATVRTTLGKLVADFNALMQKQLWHQHLAKHQRATFRAHCLVLRQWEWELSKGQLKHDSGLTKAKQDTARWSTAIQPQLQQLAAATPAGTTLDSLQAHLLALKATWDQLWEEYLRPRWRRQRLGLHHAQEGVIEAFCRKAPPWGRWLDRDTNGCLNLQRNGESMQRPLELCSWEDLEALPTVGEENQQRYKLVNDRLPKARQRLHRAAEYRRGIDGRARNNA
ncbi:hypothetical protein QJQ45_027771 [Haematococcus lacustris]|nr:hypothetical protein QJQ45_027771 [Haematococcus lacustris]